MLGCRLSPSLTVQILFETWGRANLNDSHSLLDFANSSQQNKQDFIPNPYQIWYQRVENWLSYLKKVPTVVFKASNTT